ncbi:MAG: glyoxalase [Arcicella sp.]|nr:glyoxalase [Arcicella sp.]
MNREETIKLLRPTINVEKEAESEFEIFQNEILRPILKLQNDLLNEIFRTYISKRKGAFYKFSEKEKVAYINQAVRKDMKFKHYLEGIITGMFTLDEYVKFMENEDELTKRLINLLVQRLQSQFKTESK